MESLTTHKQSNLSNRQMFKIVPLKRNKKLNFMVVKFWLKALLRITYTRLTTLYDSTFFFNKVYDKK